MRLLRWVPLFIFGLVLIIFVLFTAYKIFQPKNYSIPTTPTKNWQVYEGEIAGTRFTFDYPKSFRTNVLQIEGRTYHVLSNFELETISSYTSFNDGDFLLVLTISNNLDIHKGMQFQKEKFSGVAAKKYIGSEDKAATLVYYVNGAGPIEKNQFFIFDCHTTPHEDEEFFQICKRVASTFKFVN